MRTASSCSSPLERGNVFVETALLMSLISIASLAAISYAGQAVAADFRAAGQGMSPVIERAVGGVGGGAPASPPGSTGRK